LGTTVVQEVHTLSVLTIANASGHYYKHFELYNKSGVVQDKQVTALKQVVQLFSQSLHSPLEPYWPAGQSITHKLLLK
jgi:hypothetical protein